MIELILSFVTAYCACLPCTGHTKPSLTRWGFMPEPKWTLACPVEWRGRLLWIEGVGVGACEDTGSAITGTRVDVYYSSHTEATRFGVKKKVKAIWLP